MSIRASLVEREDDFYSVAEERVARKINKKGKTMHTWSIICRAAVNFGTPNLAATKPRVLPQSPWGGCREKRSCRSVAFAIM